MDTNEKVVLVDRDDVQIGTAPKLDVHRTGQLHRAFSVFITDDEQRVLLQRRAAGKYHSGGLWTNACCGHPRDGEPVGAAAARRLREETGLECDLTHAGSFVYQAGVGQGLVEHELDHVFTGRSNAAPAPDPNEVQEICWVSPNELRDWLARDPGAFTAWFAQALSVSGLMTIRSPIA
jgi:isopentenyl-diphosphate delta-isomerase